VVTVLQAENLLAPKRESETASRALQQLEALLEKPEPQTTLVLVAAPLDKRTRMFKHLARHTTVVDCGAPDDVAGAERWVRTRVAAAGVEIEPAAARTMAVLAGFPERARGDGKGTGDIKRLRGDIDRLLLYALGQQRVTAADVRELAGPAALQDQWGMTSAVENGQAAEALRQLSMLLDAGAEPQMILGQLGWVVRSKFPMIAPTALRAAVDALFRTDVDLKRSAGEPRVLLERLVVELSGAKRARTAAPRRW